MAAPATPKLDLQWQAVPQGSEWWATPDILLPRDGSTPIVAQEATATVPATLPQTRTVTMTSIDQAQVPITERAASRKKKGAKTIRLRPPGSKSVTVRSSSPSGLPLPEQSWQALEDATRVNGLHQTDSSRHQVGNLSDPHAQKGVLLVEPAPGQATLKIAYFFLDPSERPL